MLQPCLAPISAQTPAQTDENRVQDFVLIRNEITQIQTSLAEISRKLGQQSATVNSTSNPTYTVSATAEQASSVAAPSLTVPIDSLPSVNIVSQNIRKQIHEHKYVHLALLLIPTMDSDSQTKIIDLDGNWIVVPGLPNLRI